VQLRGDVSALDTDGTFVSGFGTTLSGTRRVTGRAQADVTASARLGVSAGVEAFGERATSSYITAEGDDLVPVKRRAIGSFAEARVHVTDRLQISTGVRAESIARAALPSSSLAGRPVMPDETTVSVNPRAAASLLVHVSDTGRAWTRIRASAGTGIRPPDAFEIAFTDNPSLRPERNRSLDAGAEVGLAGGALVAEATVFASEYDDLIVAVGRAFEDASRYRTDNISNARARGVELVLSGRTTRGLEARVAYTGLDTEILSVDGQPGVAPAPFAPGEPLIRRPRHRAAADVAWVATGWNAFARLTARSGVLDVDPSFGAFGGKLRAPGYWVADAGGSLRVTRHLEVFGRVHNLLDRHYEEALGFPALGRHALAGLRVAARR
jgi:outer membrane receptor protein involved in Fe transport